MKICTMDDLHLEFGPYPFELPDADVLILAGDICVAHFLRESRTDKEAVKHKKDVANFFHKIHAKKYSLILYVPGNHEYYRADFAEAWHIIKRFIESLGIEWDGTLSLLNRTMDIAIDKKEGRPVIFLGATMWTDYNNHSLDAMMYARDHMNDFHLIYKNGNPMMKLEPEDVYQDHIKSRAWMEGILEKFPTAKTVIVSHHAPSRQSIHPSFYGDVLGNASYASDCESLMKDNVTLWCHGHMHNSFDYTINKTRIICNPRGYKGHDLNPTFNPNLVVEI